MVLTTSNFRPCGRSGAHQPKTKKRVVAADGGWWGEGSRQPRASRTSFMGSIAALSLLSSCGLSRPLKVLGDVFTMGIRSAPHGAGGYWPVGLGLPSVSL